MTRTFAIVALRASHVVGYGLCIASASSLELTLRASTTQWLFEVIKAGGGAGGERPSPANTATWSMWSDPLPRVRSREDGPRLGSRGLTCCRWRERPQAWLRAAHETGLVRPQQGTGRLAICLPGIPLSAGSICSVNAT